jgi:hypothetical protein
MTQPCSSESKRIDNFIALSCDFDAHLSSDNQFSFYKAIEKIWEMKLRRERDRTKISNVVKKKKFLMNLPNDYPLKDVVKFFLIIVLTGMYYRKFFRFFRSSRVVIWR